MSRRTQQWATTLATAIMFVLVMGGTSARAGLQDLWQFDNSANVGQATTGTNLTSNGNAAYTAGGYTGGGLALDGAGDFLSGAVASLPTGNSSYTVSGWFNTTTNANMGIVGWGNYGTNGQVDATRTVGSGALLNYSWGGSYDLQANTPAAINDGVWHQVVATYDASTGIKQLYLDGNAIGARTVPALNVSSANFRIGSTNNGEYFNGTLDNVALYDQALSPRDVKLVTAGLYNVQTNAQLAHRYSFTSDTSDSVGGANLSLVGAASVSGGVLNLPGGSPRTNYAQATGSALDALANTINHADSITIESWFTASSLQNWAKIFEAGTDTNTNMDITPYRGDGSHFTSNSINDTAHLENNVQSGAVISANTEYYVATTWRNSGNEMSVLIRTADGTTVAQYNEASMGGQSLASVAMTKLYLGASLFGDPDFAGSINELRIWNKGISQAQSLANLVDGPDKVNTNAKILVNEDWEGNNDSPTFIGYGAGAVITGTSAVAINNFNGVTGSQTQVEIINNDTASPGTQAIFQGRSVDLNQYGVQFNFNLDAKRLLQLFVEYGSNLANGPSNAALDWRVLDALDNVVASGVGNEVNPGQISILADQFNLGAGDYRLQLGSGAVTALSGIHVDGVFLRAVPTPAALPAGLALLGLAAARRRRRGA